MVKLLLFCIRMKVRLSFMDVVISAGAKRQFSNVALYQHHPTRPPLHELSSPTRRPSKRQFFMLMKASSITAPTKPPLVASPEMLLPTVTVEWQRSIVRAFPRSTCPTSPAVNLRREQMDPVRWRLRNVAVPTYAKGAAHSTSRVSGLKFRTWPLPSNVPL